MVLLYVARSANNYKRKMIGTKHHETHVVFAGSLDRLRTSLFLKSELFFHLLTGVEWRLGLHLVFPT